MLRVYLESRPQAGQDVLNIAAQRWQNQNAVGCNIRKHRPSAVVQGLSSRNIYIDLICACRDRNQEYFQELL